MHSAEGTLKGLAVRMYAVEAVETAIDIHNPPPGVYVPACDMCMDIVGMAPQSFTDVARLFRACLNDLPDSRI